MMASRTILWFFGAAACLVVTPIACGSSGGDDDDEPSNAAQSSSASTGGSSAGGAACSMPTDVLCEDEVILGMDLRDNSSPGAITSMADGTGFISNIDATAGGAFMVDTSYTYGKFTDQGLNKIDVSDEAALTSMDWDIAFRRYVVRINSGHSGPSCVTAARIPGTPDYAAIAALPEGLTFRKDEYFTSSCELIPDGTGLEGSPATALSSYWTYPTCVQMTGNVYVIELADGRHVKFVVDSYYNATAQQQCQMAGSLPPGDTGAANFVVRWAFLP
jgi:hypothetical protein